MSGLAVAQEAPLLDDAVDATDYEGPYGVPADLRLLGVGLNACEKAFVQCSPVVLNMDLFAKLFALGIRAFPPGPFDALAYDAVLFLPGDRFEFTRDIRDATGCTIAIIFPVHDEDRDDVDLVALDIDTGMIATWRGRVSMLGQQWLSAPIVDEPLHVHETPFDWLRAGREGLFIIDPQRVRWLLVGRPLAVTRTHFGARLLAALRLEPEIFVKAELADADH